MTEPLDGLLVVALEQAVAAPYCTARLADAGARVIKVERKDGDFARHYDHVVNGGSAYFNWLNRGKESICLDIKDVEDAALLRRMIDQADVFVQNLAPLAAERAGFGAAELRATNHRLITCDISGYGPDGPLRDRKAYDLLIQGECGLASITGTPEGPGRVGISVVDVAAGVSAHAVILEALFRRQKSGEGAALSVSLFDSIADWMAVPLLHQVYGKRPPERVGLSHPSIVPYGAFECADGVAILIAIQNDREWRLFVNEILDDPDLLTDTRFSDNSARTAHRREVEALVTRTFARYSSIDLSVRLDRTGIGFASLNDVAALAGHPHLRWIDADSPEGKLRLPSPSARWQDRNIPVQSIPALNAQGREIRAEFGAEEIRQTEQS